MSLLIARDDATASPKSESGIQSSLGLSGVDLIAMVVSDSGLANCEPKWWNASPTGCMLIGLQPRGGWQIIQRAVQWGSDSWAKCFGVDCAAPILYAYFACTIRNRLEVLLSARLRSPMEGVPAGGQWNTWEDESFTVKRPTKLVDGSRGGQAFMAEVLAPEAGGGQYTIADQSRLQMLSVLMVGAGLAVDDSLASYWSAVLPADFDLSDGLGSVFGRLAIGLALGSLVAIGLMIATWWSLVATDDNVFGLALPYMVKIVSLLSWAVGAMGLLMLGGNPRVRLVDKDIPEHIKRRLATMKDEAEEPHRETGIREAVDNDVLEPVLNRTSTCVAQVAAADDANGRKKDATLDVSQAERPNLARATTTGTTMSGRTLAPTNTAPLASSTAEVPEETVPLPPKLAVSSEKNDAQATADSDPKVRIQFGSLHGSVFLPDRGACMVRFSVVERLCASDIKTVRTTGWYIGMGWFGLLLVGSVALQVGATLAPAFGADLLSLVFLLATALARGAGVAGPEEWMIPRWKRRHNTSNGAILLGQFNSRAGGGEA